MSNKLAKTIADGVVEVGKVGIACLVATFVFSWPVGAVVGSAYIWGRMKTSKNHQAQLTGGKAK